MTPPHPPLSSLDPGTERVVGWGRYTAKGPHTCQKRAASCLHEAQDAKQWAEWGIDYVKDDSCRSEHHRNLGKTLGRLGVGSEDLD